MQFKDLLVEELEDEDGAEEKKTDQGGGCWGVCLIIKSPQEVQ